MSDGIGAIAWQIPRPKITRYLLDLTSKRGASKAKYLMGFGFAREDPDTLAKALVTHAMRNLPGVEAASQIGVPVLVIEGVVTAPDGRKGRVRAMKTWKSDRRRSALGSALARTSYSDNDVLITCGA